MHDLYSEESKSREPHRKTKPRGTHEDGAPCWIADRWLGFGNTGAS